MKIIITGGLGFIGINLIDYLLQNTNHKILNIDFESDISTPNNELPFFKNEKYDFVKQDICKYEEINKIFKEFLPDCVMHLAAESHVDRSITDPLSFIKSNIIGTYNLLDISRNYFDSNNNKFKFLYVSTDEVYGSLKAEDSDYFTENSNYKPNSPYSASKASGDHLVRAWNKTFKLPTLTTHCSNNYGPWQFPEKLIPVIISKILKNETIPIYGDGKNLRDWIHVFDHAKALSSLIDIDFTGQVYNIGSDNVYTNLDLTKQICIIMSQKLNNKIDYTTLIKFVDDRLGHDFKYAINSSKLKNDINFKYRYNLDNGLSDTIEWYLLNKDWLLNKNK
jgi:dTDP-glucose 4,6-dehydratase